MGHPRKKYTLLKYHNKSDCQTFRAVYQRFFSYFTAKELLLIEKQFFLLAMK